MRMEMEEMRLQVLSSDSVKLAQQRQLPHRFAPTVAKGVPVVVEECAVFFMPTVGYTPQSVQKETAAVIEKVETVQPASRLGFLLNIRMPFPT